MHLGNGLHMPIVVWDACATGACNCTGSSAVTRQVSAVKACRVHYTVCRSSDSKRWLYAAFSKIISGMAIEGCLLG
jgi:hypothetical protein